MSEENVEVVREAFRAWNERDVARMLELCTEDIEWSPANAGAMEGRVYRGSAEAVEGWETAWQTWDEFRFEEREIRDIGESALWLGTVSARGRGSGLELEQELSNHILFRDGKIARSESYLTWQQGLEAAGLEE
jgi:ketosteroid isomerase-like protein